MTVPYFTKVASPEQLARRWAAQQGHPAPPPGKAYSDHYGTPGPAGVDQDAAMLVDQAALERAKAIAQRYQVEGYGTRRCGTGCAGCTYGGACRRPVSLAMATLRREQAAADRIDHAEADAMACQRAAFAWEVAHGMRL